MKWEESVMNILEIDNLVGDECPCNNCPTPDGDCDDCMHLRIANAQAEISFKAGMRVVIEWMERTKKGKVPKYQLKEWGLD